MFNSLSVARTRMSAKCCVRTQPGVDRMLTYSSACRVRPTVCHKWFLLNFLLPVTRSQNHSPKIHINNAQKWLWLLRGLFSYRYKITGKSSLNPLTANGTGRYGTHRSTTPCPVISIRLPVRLLVRTGNGTHCTAQQHAMLHLLPPRRLDPVTGTITGQYR